MKRRSFLRSALLCATASQLGKLSFAADSTSLPATLTLHPDRTGAFIDPEFVGLSYESAQLQYPDFFSGANHELIGFVRGLAPRGVLRIGGNTSEYATWTPHPPEESASQNSSGIVGPDKGHTQNKSEITPLAIRNLREFLDATGWRSLYGLNLGTGTPQKAADEAAYVAKMLGDKLIAFQIGNEVDLFHRNGLRPSSYDFAAYAKEWRQFHSAIRARVPDARFAGPDSADTTAWIAESAQEFHEDLILLTTHFYAEGPPANPAMTIERLLSPDNPHAFQKSIETIRNAMASSHLPYRLAETNSCYQGGKPGVSDTFASALWAGDLMGQLASFGASGVNFHGGGYGWYTPIAGTIKDGFTARPEYYGILMFSQLLGSRMIESSLDANGSNGLLTAYAARAADGSTQIAVYNKSAGQSITLNLRSPASVKQASLQRLIAPRLDDTQDVTFGRVPLNANGNQPKRQSEPVKTDSNGAQCTIPAASAALIRLD